MQLHQIKTKLGKNKKRIGRGGKRGTFSGRGVKGQKSRAGRKMRPEWRDTLKRIPKKRGYKFNSRQAKVVVFNLDVLSRSFKEGESVNPSALRQKGLIVKIKGTWPDVKILGNGELNKKLNFKELKISAGAKEKIIKAGGIIQ